MTRDRLQAKADSIIEMWLDLMSLRFLEDPHNGHISLTRMTAGFVGVLDAIIVWHSVDVPGALQANTALIIGLAFLCAATAFGGKYLLALIGKWSFAGSATVNASTALTGDVTQLAHELVAGRQRAPHPEDAP